MERDNFSENAIAYLTDEVGNTAALLVSPLASAITGSTIYVDNGLNTMGLRLTAPLCRHKHCCWMRFELGRGGGCRDHSF
jgi:hypothetical protein